MNTEKKVLTSRFNIFLCDSILTFLGILLFAIFSNIIRFVFLYNHQESFHECQRYLSYCLFLGTRFDLKTAAILFSPIFLIGLSACFFKNQHRIIFYVYRFLICSILFLSVFIMIGNDYFYQAFNTNFNHAIFGFVGQPDVVLLIIWQDYPIILILFLLFICYYITWKLLGIVYKKLMLYKMNISKYTKTAYVLLFLIGYFYIARGSFDTQPLPKANTAFTDNKVINLATCNGVLALYKVLITRTIPWQPENLLIKNGLDSYNTYHNKELLTEEFSFEKLFITTPYNLFLEQKPPHVVFVQLESAGRHLLLFDDPNTNNLLGSLRKHVDNDFFFTHFLSGGNWTRESLTSLIFSSLCHIILEPSLNTAQFKTSVALPYYEAGYKTIFLTSGSVGWQNTGTSLQTHGFNLVIGDFDIMIKYPEAAVKGYGVPDQYVFDYAYSLLEEANRDNQPLFIYINTNTNHSPYHIPPNYNIKPLKVPEEFSHAKKISNKKMLTMMTTYQYTHSMLGDFIDHVEASHFNDKTIIAASGDHNQHELKPNYTDYKEYALQYGVFFLLHIPKNYLPNTTIDVNQLASHKDIFPTLFNLSLSEANYPNLGHNLTAFEPTQPFIFAFNESCVLLESGLIKLDEPQPLLYPWQDDDRIYLKEGRPLMKEEEHLLNRIHAYSDLLSWQIIWQHQSMQTNKKIN